MNSVDWTAWQPLPGGLRLRADVLAETLDGGQAFRWRQEKEGAWLGVWSDHVGRVRLDADGALAWSALRAETGVALANYLGSNETDRAVDALPWRSDAHLARCLTDFPGLGILRQPFGETLLGFLCSATKQIVQIKQMIALLAERHGTPIGGGFNRLPTWTEIATIPEAELRACLLGFRARYIHQTAQVISAQPGWLEETAALPYADAKTRLCGLPGVGEKVADCVLLFGAGKMEAFPVDVWILKAMAERYSLQNWKPAQVAHFGRIHFGPLAGLAQQYLFAWERAQARRSK